jgi:hypothetical protein
MLTQKATLDITTPDGNEIILKKGRKFTQSTLRKLQQLGIDRIPVLLEDVLGAVVANDVVDMNTGEVLVECNDEITESKIEAPAREGDRQVRRPLHRQPDGGPLPPEDACRDKIETPDEAVVEIYKRLRPGDPPMLETAYNLFNNLFFNPERYDLSQVGRLKLNHKFKLNEALDNTVLTKRDIIECVRYLIALARRQERDDARERRWHVGRTPGQDRRHRPPRQSPGARGRRAHGEPVPHRSRSDGAGDQRAHEHVSGDRDAHAARPDQCEARLRGGQGVLRFEPALSVHGPDQPAQRGDPQASPLGPRARRSDP